MCEECPRRDIFIVRELENGCECSISEERGRVILEQTLNRWCQEPPSGWSTIPELLSLLSLGAYRDDFIQVRDMVIIDTISKAVKYVFGSEKLGMWDYLDVGSGTCIPTLKISELLGTHPLGVDYANRRKCVSDKFFTVIKDETMPYGDTKHRLITMCDILHHTPRPERLARESLSTLEVGGYILIMDVDCESWEDSYYFDLWHGMFASAVGGKTSGEYLPSYGYRSRRYWRAYMKEAGCELIYSDNIAEQYKTYVDVFRKST